MHFYNPNSVYNTNNFGLIRIQNYKDYKQYYKVSIVKIQNNKDYKQYYKISIVKIQNNKDCL